MTLAPAEPDHATDEVPPTTEPGPSTTSSAPSHLEPVPSHLEPASSTPRDEREVRYFVEGMARLFADWGFPRMAGRVLMMLTVADERTLSAGELATRLAVSPAAISGAVRYLIQIGMVVREPVAGSRRDHYRLVHDTWHEATVTKLTVFQAVAVLADEGVRALGGPGTAAGARVAEMRDYYLFVQRELPALLARWTALKEGRTETGTTDADIATAR